MFLILRVIYHGATLFQSNCSTRGGLRINCKAYKVTFFLVLPFNIQKCKRLSKLARYTFFG